MQQPNLIKDKQLARKVAKGIIYCWASIITADGLYKEDEFHTLEDLANSQDVVKENVDKESLKTIFGEALDIIKNYSIDELFNRIEFVFRDIDKTARCHVFFTSLHLACIDREIANREIMILQKIYHALNIDIDSVFRISLLFFQNEFSKRKKE
jgi:uncharacterized tellurite resistance protein B-like protein